VTGIGAEPRVRVLTRDGCHLCDEVLVVVRRVCAELGVGLAEVDVDADAELRAEYTDHVPVTFVDGRRFDFWRIDEGRLRAALGN
jgi:glutaredoxin